MLTIRRFDVYYQVLLITESVIAREIVLMSIVEIAGSEFPCFRPSRILASQKLSLGKRTTGLTHCAFHEWFKVWIPFEVFLV